MRQPLTVAVPDSDRAPAATADLDGAARPGMLAESAVKGRAAHPGQVHQLTDVGSLVRRDAQREPRRATARRETRAAAVRRRSVPAGDGDAVEPRLGRHEHDHGVAVAHRGSAYVTP